jgi:serine O-acetyltransferase
MAQPLRTDECRRDIQVEVDEHQAKVVPEVVKELVASCGTQDCFDHVSPVPIPTQESVASIIHAGRRILFPGYFSEQVIDPVGLEYYIGQEITNLYLTLAKQITWAVRHDCFRYELECKHCQDKGREQASMFLKRLIELRHILAADVRAAYEGDPASKSFDQIIFSYPGLLAITVYRMAHVLYEMGVPLLPRIMTEWAHGKTGIDIHPGAEIGESFFIDHGTGVVIGETSWIGNHVRIYQGVTLGALSLPRDAGETMRGKKRHPTIEEDVIIYSGATILGGDTIIGARSVIGGNVWLTESVPPDTRVIIKKPELVISEKKRRS